MSQITTKDSWPLDDLWHKLNAHVEADWSSRCSGPSPLRAGRTAETASPTHTVTRDRAGAKLCVWRNSASWTGLISSGGHIGCAGVAAEHVKQCSWRLSRRPNTPPGTSLYVLLLYSPLSARSSGVREHASGSTLL